MTDSTDARSGSLRMVGTVKRALWVYAGPFTIGVVLTYIYVVMVLRTGHLILFLLLIPLYVYAFADLILWLRSGIRIVEMDATGITLYRQSDQTPKRIDTNQITAVHVSRSLDRITVNILLRGASVTTFLGLKRYSGPRIRITVEPFDRKEFADFARRIANFGRTVEKQ